MAQIEGFVGLDGGKFEIYVFINKTGSIFSVPNTASGHAKLQSQLGKPLGQIIAAEPTGGYEWAVWQVLDEAGFDVRQVSAAHVRAFARASGALAKTDPIDARLIAQYMAFRSHSGRRLPAENCRHLNAFRHKTTPIGRIAKAIEMSNQTASRP